MTKLSEDILRLKSEGKTYNEIKAELGCSKGTISYHLGAGQKEKTRHRQTQNRTKIKGHIRDLKASTPCADCGVSYNYWVMELDHLDPSIKYFQVSSFSSYTSSLTKVLEEIQKCEVVCGNCHKDRSYQNMKKKNLRGTNTPYNAWQREYREAVRDKIRELKSGACTDCSNSYPYWVMEFDHLGADLKLFNIGNYESKVRSFEAVQLEIQKCELVCCNCHSERTHQRYLASIVR